MSSPPYTIVVKRKAQKDIDRLPDALFARIRERIAMLANNPLPPGSKKMKGYEKLYRIRVGQYRVVYEVAAEIRIIAIIRIGHRKDIYRFFA